MSQDRPIKRKLFAGEPIDRQTLVRGAVASACVLLVGLAFVFSYVGALHQPKFHHLALAVVAPPAVAAKLGQGGDFQVIRVDTREDIVSRIDDRGAYGGLVLTPTHAELLVASEAGLAVANELRAALPRIVGAASHGRLKTEVTDVKPLPVTDTGGVTPFYLVVGLIVANYVGAVFFAMVFGVKAAGRRVWWRLAGVFGTAVVLGFGEVAIVNALGPLRGHFFALALVGIFLGATAGTVTVGLQSVFGVIGTALAVQLFVVLGNPSSGGPYATPLLPGFWRVIGPYLPAGAGVDLVRNITYFNGHAIGRPIWVLVTWLALAVAFAAGSTLVRPLGVQMKQDQDRLDQQTQAETLTAAG